MLTEQEAVAKVEEHLRELGRHLEGGLVVMPEYTVALPYGWLFMYQSRRFLQTFATEHAIAGNAPLVVMAATGEIVSIGTALPSGDALVQFERKRGIGRFPRRPRSARVDLPLATTSLFLYVDEKDRALGPWWNAFYDYLLSFASDELEWKLLSGPNVYCARPSLTDAQRHELGERLRATPPEQVEHRAPLRFARRTPPERDPRLAILYYADPQA